MLPEGLFVSGYRKIASALLQDRSVFIVSGYIISFSHRAFLLPFFNRQTVLVFDGANDDDDENGNEEQTPLENANESGADLVSANQSLVEEKQHQKSFTENSENLHSERTAVATDEYSSGSDMEEA
jgi:hypothetical protein